MQTRTSTRSQRFLGSEEFLWYREPAIGKLTSEALAAVLLPGGAEGVNRAIVDDGVAAQK